MVVRSGLVFQNRPVVLHIPLPSSNSKGMLSVHRAESHSSHGWQRWPYNADTWDARDWSVCTSKACSGYLRNPCAQNRDLKRPSGLTLNTLIEPIILRLFGAETNSQPSCLDMFASSLSIDACHYRAWADAMASLWFLGTDGTLHAFGVSRSGWAIIYA